jgi:hypothetical protein
MQILVYLVSRTALFAGRLDVVTVANSERMMLNPFFV